MPVFYLPRYLCCLAVLALLLMQQLGLGHRYVHGMADASPWQAATQSRAQVPTSGAPTSFPAHDASLCCVLDHLSTGDALTPPPLLLATVMPSLTYLSLLSGNFIARWAALFQARGPPVSL